VFPQRLDIAASAQFAERIICSIYDNRFDIEACNRSEVCYTELGEDFTYSRNRLDNFTECQPVQDRSLSGTVQTKLDAEISLVRRWHGQPTKRIPADVIRLPAPPMQRHRAVNLRFGVCAAEANACPIPRLFTAGR
jgi:hypothetical protein